LLSARLLLVCCLPLLATSTIAAAQKEVPPQTPLYARTNSFGIFSAYSNNSSPILLGESRQRKLLEVGASYSRRIVLNRKLNWQYDGEILPLVFNSDPVETVSFTETSVNPPNTTTTTYTDVPVTACHYETLTVSGPNNSFTLTETCSRRWVYGGGISPVGFRWNLLPQHKLQPFLVGHGGFLETINAIPIRLAGSFNFTFDLGAGFEWYRSHSRSWRTEYRYHHISNALTAPQNPGIDSGLFQVTYVFGR
jgi:Lipid A 3-O-deacylase (PagL)